MEIDWFKQIEITDEDINWAELFLKNGIHFDDTRRIVIKSMDSIDVQAFPGSGKTTVLVAKLAILAKKWPHINSGMWLSLLLSLIYCAARYGNNYM